MQIFTLLFLIQDQQILLAMKKRGRGAGLWNGIGGKPEAGENIDQTMIRECQEEIGVTPTTFEKVAIQDFKLVDGTPDGQIHTYICRAWQGEPIETEEMAPQWFAFGDIPYAEMWPDDSVWLPSVLLGRKLRANFIFDGDNDMRAADIKFTTEDL